MKTTTTRRRFLAKSAWTGIGFLLFSFTTIGVAGNRPACPSLKTRDSVPAMRHGWLLNQDDL